MAHITTETVREVASSLRTRIADAEEQDGVLTPDGAKHIAKVLRGVDPELRGHVFTMLDSKPGLWHYEDDQGREYHYKLRQFRNHHRDEFKSAFAA